MRHSTMARPSRRRIFDISWKLPWFCVVMTVPLIIILLPWMASEWDPEHDFHRPLGTKKLSNVALHEGSFMSKLQETFDTMEEEGNGSMSTTGSSTRHIGDHLDEGVVQANGSKNGVQNQADSNQENQTERIDGNLPRIAYLIMSSRGESLGLVSLLAAIYHPANAYAVHCDARIPEEEKEILHIHVRENMPSNVLWMKSSAVTWGGISMLLVTLRGIAQLRRDLGDNWDYFINLSASDMPLLPQDYIASSLKNAPLGASFMSGAPYKGPDAGSGIYRTKQLIVDNAIHLGKNLNSTMEWPGGERSVPTIFVPYKGEGWFILSKDLAKQATDSAEYWFGILLSYFSNWFAADESYMQTLACTESGMEASTTYLDNFRHIVWSNIALGHPDVLEGTEALAAALSSGALFARKFPVDGIERRALIHYVHSWPNSSMVQQNTGYDNIIALYKKFSQFFFAEVSKTTNVSVEELEGEVEIALLKLHELRPMQIQALEKRISDVDGKYLCPVQERSTSE